MNSFSVLAFLLCVSLSYSAPEPPKGQDKAYSTQFDHIDLEPILKSKRLVGAYVKCVIQNVGCTNEGKVLRDYLPDALRTSCTKCSIKQREGAVKIISRLEKEYPDEFKKVLDAYDPDRKFIVAFKKANPQ